MRLLSRTMSNTPRLLAFAGALLLSACSGVGSSVTDAFPILSSAYAPTSVWYATKDGMRTVIHGNPFSVPQAQANAAVLAGLRMPAWHQKGEFIEYPIDGRRRGYRLVLVFNPAHPINFGDACGDLDEIGIGPAAGRTRVRAVFCSRERPLSQIDGAVTASGLDDPAFRRLLADTLDQLLPPENFGNANDCNRPTC